MLGLKHISLLSAVSLVLFACQTPSASDNTPSDLPDPAHNSKNSLDWSGTYSGVLPSEGGQALRTTITLHSDGTYIFDKQVENTGEPENAAVQVGELTWQADGSRIVLEKLNGGSPNYLVGENQLIQLDQNGERITGEMADKFTLQRSDEMGGMTPSCAYRHQQPRVSCIRQLWMQ